MNKIKRFLKPHEDYHREANSKIALINTLQMIVQSRRRNVITVDTAPNYS